MSSLSKRCIPVPHIIRTSMLKNIWFWVVISLKVFGGKSNLFIRQQTFIGKYSTIIRLWRKSTRSLAAAVEGSYIMPGFQHYVRNTRIARRLMLEIRLYLDVTINLRCCCFICRKCLSFQLRLYLRPKLISCRRFGQRPELFLSFDFVKKTQALTERRLDSFCLPHAFRSETCLLELWLLKNRRLKLYYWSDAIIQTHLNTT